MFATAEINASEQCQGRSPRFESGARSGYFHDLLDECAGKRRPTRVLAACFGGPAVLDWLARNPDARVSIHCLEVDSRAVEFARGLPGARDARVRFEQSSLIGFGRGTQRYDLVCAASLDCLKDVSFKETARVLFNALGPGGTFAIGAANDVAEDLRVRLHGACGGAYTVASIDVRFDEPGVFIRVEGY